MFAGKAGRICVGNLGATLVHEPNPIATRLGALQELRSIAASYPFHYETARAIQAIATGLFSSSILLRQKCVHALGQSRHPAVLDILQEILNDRTQDLVTRLEAARGLGVLRYSNNYLNIIADLMAVSFDDDEDDLLKGACEVASARMGWELSTDDLEMKQDFSNPIDAAPPFLQPATVDPVSHFSDILFNDSESLFAHCRAITSLRNLCQSASPSTIFQVVVTLTHAHPSSSPILRYHLILAFAHIKHESAIPYLFFQLRNEDSEHEVVRAAAAESLGQWVGDPKMRFLMKDFRMDKKALVGDCVKTVMKIKGGPRMGRLEISSW